MKIEAQETSKTERAAAITTFKPAIENLIISLKYHTDTPAVKSAQAAGGP
ncbi:MAG TPA: hypothetical protein PL001_04335 [Candidatus Kryptobacter bacterium]|nr:hypothetical protein [Candidatus Kryptobacter bacterium]